MKTILALGIILILIGGAMLTFPIFSWKDEHKAEIGNLDIKFTETEHSRFPKEVAYVLLGVGGAMSVLAAVKWPGNRIAA